MSLPNLPSMDSLTMLVPNLTLTQWLTLGTGIISIRTVFTYIYNLYLHPLCHIPGPRLAAASNLWYAYHDLSGRRPWRMAEVVKKYGDVVRIGPNEILFTTPQAASDIHMPHEKYHETFVKTDAEDVGTGDRGLTWEADPVKHRKIAKMLAPAFSSRSLKAKEATIHKHIDMFVEQMRTVGQGGAELRQWSDWLAMDLSADMTYNCQMNQMKDMKNSLILDCILKTDLFATLRSLLTSKFPLFTPLMYLFIPPSVIFSVPRAMKANSDVVRDRISRRGRTEHLDYFEQLLPAEDVPSSLQDKKQLALLKLVPGQLLAAGWDPLSNQLYAGLFFILQNPKGYEIVTNEIRGTFTNYEDITVEAVNKLEYVDACMMETFRIYTPTTDGLPRKSPGAMVDGLYVPQGVTVQTSHFSASRNPRYFADPAEYRPERWLRQDHPLYDTRFDHDNRKAVIPFNQGPRMCPASVVAPNTLRLFFAKVLWSFDIAMVPGQRQLSFDRDFCVRFLWHKPEFFVTFTPVVRK